MKKSAVFGSAAALAVVLPCLGWYIKSKQYDEFHELYREKERDVELMEKIAKREHLKVLKDDTELLAATLAWLDVRNGTMHLLDIIGYPPNDNFVDECLDEDEMEEITKSQSPEGLYVTEEDIWVLKLAMDEDIRKKREVFGIVSDAIYDAPISVLDVNINNCF